MKPSKGISLSERWVHRYTQRHPELKPKYTSKYDYQCARCEDPKVLQKWFGLVRETVQRYGILEEDIYNMDETGFQMGKASTVNVTCGSESRDARAKVLQPENREWVYSKYDY